MTHMQALPLLDARTGGRPAIALSHAGRGELVLFLHGVGGNRTNWLEQLRAFSPHFLAAAWDMRGYGTSDGYEGPLSFADICDDLLRVMAYFGAESAHLVGLSMGGRIAFDFLRRHPGSVRSLTICSALHRASQMPPQRRREFLDSRLRPLREGKSLADIASAVARSLVSAGAPPGAYEALEESMRRLQPEGYMKALEAVSSYEGEIELDAIQVPTHVIGATEDSLVDIAAVRAMAARIPGSRLSEIEACGHLSNLEQPEAFNRLALDFLLAQEGIPCSTK
ncbi:alpha/beta fold hydrolase [Achromobacter sp. RTa]|uniref:alpha/beta fold hydrolase n=1 Tax=Achromobacter sp. RTa TaxID=1532557 RepID=UPI0006903DFC|nr:alpha/beta fold hydrolase [Achromobacter sp. RTa]